MRYVVVLMGVVLVFTARASAQEEAGAASDEVASTATDAKPEESPVQQEPANPPQEEKRSPYYKKVQGWLWIEGFAGPSAYDPDRFGSLNVGGTNPNAPRLNGPEYGFAIGTAFGGPFFLGWFYRQANYTKSAPAGQGYKLLKTGLDMQGNLRFVPYVHPILRASIGYAKIFDGNPYGLTNTDSDGLSLTGGVGVRIPVVRWMSIAATFDWTFIALSLRGDDPSGARFQSWISGHQYGATFAISFHFIGVRKN